MSVLRLRATLLPRFRPASLAPQVRAVHSSVHGNDPNILSKEKARNLSGSQDTSAPHKEHAPGWNEHLASDSEANVKADQAGPSGKPGKDLQDATVDHTHKHHHSDSGPGPHVSPAPEPTMSEEFVRADQGEKI